MRAAAKQDQANWSGASSISNRRSGSGAWLLWRQWRSRCCEWISGLCCGGARRNGRSARWVLAGDRRGIGIGRRVLKLLQGFAQYDTWETLAPSVLGVSAMELDAAWHARR